MTSEEFNVAMVAKLQQELDETDWGPDVSDQGRTIQLLAYRKYLEERLDYYQTKDPHRPGAKFTVLG